MFETNPTQNKNIFSALLQKLFLSYNRKWVVDENPTILFDQTIKQLWAKYARY